MLLEYISKKLNQAQYKILDDGNYFGEIQGLQGVWASEKKLEDCRESLREILEEWLMLKLQDRDRIPGLSIRINHRVGLMPSSAPKNA